MSPSRGTPITSLRIPPDLRAAVVERAQRDGVPVTVVILAALRAYLEDGRHRRMTPGADAGRREDWDVRTMGLRKAPKVIEFAFCERSTATPMSQEHIRRVGPEGLKNGGGAPDTTLCGDPLRGGWDLTQDRNGEIISEVTDDRVRDLSTPRAGDGRVFLCPRCADAWPTR